MEATQQPGVEVVLILGGTPPKHKNQTTGDQSSFFYVRCVFILGGRD